MTTETMHIDLNDMYIEDDGSAFDSLEDGFSDDQIEEASLGAENVEAEDLYEEDEVDFEGLGEEDGEDVEYDDEDELDEDAEYEDEDEYEDYEEEGDATITDEDGEEVDFEEFEVTLPTGDVVKLNEAIRGYKDAETLLSEREAFEAEKEQYRVDTASVKRLLELAKLEAERVIEDYQDFDWATISREDPQVYVENREFLDKYKTRHKEILSEMEHLETQIQNEKSEAIKMKAAATNNILSREIPGWNRDLYIDLMTYAVKDLGMEEDFVVNTVDAGFFRSVYKAKQLDQGKQTVKAKIKRLGGSPKKVVKAAPKTNKTANNKKAILRRKMETGAADERDVSNAFDFLED